jgi:PHP family Zn ribbon phosphoesterase
MTFERLRAADWVAFLAALGLLFVTAADWYSTQRGRQAREFERAEERGAEFREVKPAA